MDSVIEVKNLCRKFGKFTAVNNINFNIKKGEILGFLGPNGAGKTTTIKMITGLLKISSGNVFIKGMDAVKERKKVKTITGYMSQKFSLYPTLTGLENITFFGGISGLSKAEILRKIEEIKTEIPESNLKMKIGDMPPGIKQQIALFVCLLNDPELIFLDEPTSGVDPENRRKFWEEIYRLKVNGKTLLVSTHNLDEAEYADRIIIIHKGDIILQGEPEYLKNSHNVKNIELLFKEAIENYDKT